MLLSDLINRFEYTVRAGLRSARTVDNYRHHLVTAPRALAPYLAHRNISRLSEVTPDHLIGYLAELSIATSARGKPYSPATIADYDRTLRRFFRWAATETASLNPMERIPVPVKYQPYPRGIELESARTLIASCDRSPTGYRDRALMLFLLNTGCRVQAISQMRKPDLILGQRLAILHEKGKRTRMVALHPDTVRALKSWIIRAPASEYVFTGKRRMPLSPSGVLQMLYRRQEQTGVPGPVNPHAWRHAYVREVLLSGMDIALVSAYLDHRSIQTTAMIYGVMARHHIINSARRHDPINRLK